MKFIKNVVLSLIMVFAFEGAVFALTGATMAQPANAQFTILPSAANVSDADCKARLDTFEISRAAINSNELLGCAIKTGRISMSMIPYFITYFSNFLLSIVGLVAMLFIVLGGYWYIFGGMMEQKEKGKKFIGNALKGMVIAILSWTIVTVIINLVTS